MYELKTLSITELRANLLSAIEAIKKGETITVTSHGKPVAQLGPLPNRREEAIAKIKALRKTAIIGDVVSPAGETWEAS